MKFLCSCTYEILSHENRYEVYPDGYSKGQKYSLGRSTKSYKLATRNSKLYYVDTQQDGTMQLFN